MAEASTPPRSTLLATAQSVVDGYTAWSIEAILAPRSTNCTQHILPHSLGIPPMNNSQYASYFRPNLAYFRNFHVDVQETVVDAEARKVVMLARSSAETDIGEYANEYVLVVEMGRDGRQAEKVVEWVDSGYSVRFLGQLRRHGEVRQSEIKDGDGGTAKI